jgi:hypothetical protein
MSFCFGNDVYVARSFRAIHKSKSSLYLIIIIRAASGPDLGLAGARLCPPPQVLDTPHPRATAMIDSPSFGNQDNEGL